MRWNVLLNFNCRNRLLLTGTPIQNTMQELWALLHFIMPTLFDSHAEFAEWFSKDIERYRSRAPDPRTLKGAWPDGPPRVVACCSTASHATGETDRLDQGQLSRLHMILKPFMLRRVKKDVENELGDKVRRRAGDAVPATAF